MGKKRPENNRNWEYKGAFEYCDRCWEYRDATATYFINSDDCITELKRTKCDTCNYTIWTSADEDGVDHVLLMFMLTVVGMLFALFGGFGVYLLVLVLGTLLFILYRGTLSLYYFAKFAWKWVYRRDQIRRSV